MFVHDVSFSTSFSSFQAMSVNMAVLVLQGVCDLIPLIPSETADSQIIPSLLGKVTDAQHVQHTKRWALVRDTPAERVSNQSIVGDGRCGVAFFIKYEG